MEHVKKDDFVEIKFAGYVNGKVFDSNIEEELKKLNPEAKPEKTIIIVGKGMVVSGLDKALEEKEIGKDYEIHLSAKEGFGERKKELMKTIPLKVFTEKRLEPRPGMVLALNDMIAKIIAVSGARVITDFNNPLAGKELDYKFSILRKVDDEKEKCETTFLFLFRFVPEFEIGEKVIVKGIGELEHFILAAKEKFKEMTGKDMVFELKEKKEEIKKEAGS